MAGLISSNEASESIETDESFVGAITGILNLKSKR